MIHFPPGIDATLFLRDYWQQRPLLIRQGLPGFSSPIDGDELAGLALEDEVESRLVIRDSEDGPWELRQGPFSEEDFARLPASPWTLLVQAVDLWVPEVRAIIDDFAFLPRWRMDDIMVSYANDGGGVGPHFDYYDVFLIQGWGQREWAIGDWCDETTPLLAGSALRILDHFEPRHSWVLEPGDILYLPPRLAHCGTAVGECLTYSLGFRAPTAGEMLDDLATEVLSRGPGHFYRDPPLTPAMATDLIDPAFIDRARALLLEALDDRERLAEWFASFMTRPKYPGLDIDDPDCARRATLPALDDKPARAFVDGEPCDHSGFQ
ncbi:MAG: cupin domain-containing protein [Bacteroidales bacterium]|nr:cupin domain-containing protein [Bacteroidales bacterium]